MAQLLDHLQVILHPLLDALRLDGVAHLLKESDLLPQSILYLTDRRVLLLLSRDKEVGRIDLVRLKRSLAMEGDGIQLLNGVDLVVPPRHPQYTVRISHGNIHGVSPYTEVAARQVEIVADIERGDQLTQESIAVQRLPLLDTNHRSLHGRRATHTIDAGDRRHDDDVLAPR